MFLLGVRRVAAQPPTVPRTSIRGTKRLRAPCAARLI